ncbi:flagellar motor switch protein FliG [Vibrio sp.]|nr:flagellar motor switch protein FliG [Vibrio sp.]
MPNLTQVAEDSAPIPSLKSSLKKIDQAAILLLGLGEKNAGKVMKNFTRREFELVAQAMTKLQGIQVDEAKGTITEFFDEFKHHSGIQGASKQFLDSMLNSALGDNIGKGLVANIYGDEIREKMQKLQWIPENEIYRIIQHEHKKIICAFLAYLPPETSSSVLSYFDNDTRAGLLYSISQIEGLDQNVAEDLLNLIDECAYEYTSNKSASLKGTKQVADIINRFEGDKGDLLKVLRERDKDTFEKIQENMFDFYLLANQKQEVLESLHDYIGLERWAVALKGTNDDLRKVLFNSLTTRQVKELKELMEEKGSVPLSTVRKAQSDIMEEVRQLNEEGVIEIMLYQETVVQ